MTKEFICTSTEPVVSTVPGKLRGFKFGSTYTFHGIKYAEAKRFMMPIPVQPWEGVKDALSYGYIAPLMNDENPGGDLMVPHRFWPKSEDCQYLNIWTQSVNTKAKKPVLVWLHGGGFSGGSSIEMVAYDGNNLSEAGDVVVVSLNHRLNIIGFLDLSAFGDRYWNSGNVGMADIVTALQWIHDNIEAFGGDPDNVTIFGQSGGGGKVHTLLQVPAADHLFQKGIIESGMWADGGLPYGKTDEHTKLAEGMIKALGGSSADILETVTYDELVKAYFAAAPALNERGIETGFGPHKNSWFAGNTLNVDFTEAAKKKPVMVGTVMAEFAFGPGVQEKFRLSEEECVAIVRKKYGEHTDEVLALFKETYPGKNLTDATVLDSFFRGPALDFLDKRARDCEAPTYGFVFAFDFPYNGGAAAWHCAEIPFAFRNTDKVAVCNVPGVSEKLEEQVSNAWINFARTGNPSNEALGVWPAYKQGEEYTMVFSDDSKARKDYDRKIIRLLQKVAPFAAPGASAKKK
jgi:para-nitrobenzyl esterase